MDNDLADLVSTRHPNITLSPFRTVELRSDQSASQARISETGPPRLQATELVDAPASTAALEMLENLEDLGIGDVDSCIKKQREEKIVKKFFVF